MIVGVKYMNDDFFYTKLKKHFCPYCSVKLVVIRKSKVVHSNSAEAHKYDFQLADGWATGNVKFVWSEFHCSHCHRDYSIDRMRQVEKARKNTKKSCLGYDENTLKRWLCE